MWFVAHRFCSAPAIYQDYKGLFFVVKGEQLWSVGGYKITQEENTRDLLIVVNFIITVIKLDNLNPRGDSKLKNDREMKQPPLIHPLRMQRDLMISDYLI